MLAVAVLLTRDERSEHTSGERDRLDAVLPVHVGLLRVHGEQDGVAEAVFAGAARADAMYRLHTLDG